MAGWWCCFLLLPSLADLPDDCSQALLLNLNDTFSETIGNTAQSNDTDWYAVDLPAGKVVHFTVIPDDDNLDLVVQAFQGCTTSGGTRNLNGLGGTEQLSIYYSQDVRKAAYLKVTGTIGKGAEPGNLPYTITTETFDKSAPIVRIDAYQRQFKPNDWFNLDISVTNITAFSQITDLYVILEWGGLYYFFPSGGEAVDGWMGNFVPSRGSFEVNDFLLFQVPFDFPPIGPLRFYAGAYAQASGQWSNIVVREVSF